MYFEEGSKIAELEHLGRDYLAAESPRSRQPLWHPRPGPSPYLSSVLRYEPARATIIENISAGHVTLVKGITLF
ncbi:hypothetical protein D6D17_09619 [Aureobasidium pullulans]|nr:hypothetical protein D6D17_09619 [Aureobasidium pullulans]